MLARSFVNNKLFDVIECDLTILDLITGVDERVIPSLIDCGSFVEAMQREMIPTKCFRQNGFSFD